ncbi:MAG: type II secretion system F family protein [bacterium]
MEFNYEAFDAEGKPQTGLVNAASSDAAIAALQQKGLTITNITSGKSGGGFGALFSMHLSFFGGVSTRDIVLLSRQIATLFEAQVSALRVFRLLSEQASKDALRDVLVTIGDDLQSGSSVSDALARHPQIFSAFYVSMVRAGEESGKLNQTFLHLADYIDRSYELGAKARNALVYPAFIMTTFVVVMVLMLTIVIPKIGAILTGNGQTLPVYTQIILGFSSFLIDYGVFILIALLAGGFFVYQYSKTPAGQFAMSRVRLSIPYVGALYQKLYLARFSDNMHVMLTSGISAVRSLEITANVIENRIYEQILLDALEEVKAGSPLSQALGHYPNEIPKILVQMLQVGEETGETGNILERLAKFYDREVNSAVDTLVSLIEPVLIVALAIGVGFLLAAVLLPIYNSTTSI